MTNMVRTADRSFYELLEVSTSASREEIEESYHRIVDFMGPQSLAMYAMFDDDEAERLRAQIDEAYRTLTDPERRAAYDRGTSTYPSVMLPQQEKSPTNLSMGHVRRETPAVQLPEPAYLTAAGPPAGITAAAVMPPVTAPAVVVAPAVAVLPPAPLRPVLDTANKRRVPSPVPPLSPERGRRRMLQPRAGIEVGPDTEFSGSLLRRLRESADATLEDVADITKISKRYINALEENDFDILPAFVYVRGFVCEYARALGLDTKLVANSYMALYRRYRGESS